LESGGLGDIRFEASNRQLADQYVRSPGAQVVFFDWEFLSASGQQTKNFFKTEIGWLVWGQEGTFRRLLKPHHSVGVTLP
jgi:hypothetical protein